MATLDPTDRDAVARLNQLLQSFGLSSLASKVLSYIQEGMGEDSIMLELQNTKEWKARFSANETRRSKGLPVLSPAEYLATERSYRQIMQEAGVPTGFYDQNTDFTKFLADDISPAELQGRVKTATDFVQAADPAQLAYMRQYYTKGDLIAYALDPKRAAPLVGKAYQAATIGGIAAQDGLTLGVQTAEQLANAGVDQNAAREGFGALGQQRQTLDNLAGISGESALTADQLAQGAFLGNADVNQKVSRLKSQERGRFAGSSGIGQGSLSQGGGGL